MTRTFERRVFPAAGAQIIRADDRTGTLTFRGRPWVYGALSADLGGWNEVITPGAATRTLARDPDVRFLTNHDANLLLARTVSGTLTLTEDDEGGIAESEMANVSYARDLAVLIERGDLTQMSFGFWITSDEWAGNLHRVHEFDLDGGDVSAVTFPAYPQTSSELRSAAARHIDGAGTPPGSPEQAEESGVVRRALEGLAMPDAVERALIELREGRVLSASNRTLVTDARDALSELLEKTEQKNSGDTPETYPTERALDRLRSLEAIASL
ncbi:HK97 family phage prohead protease [Nocardioides alkalitolerans]|uniref:HK97 family phage prohead protease n=1 Tax=Nocardioides alkalitolerans TaxID=281714 RepID=UPI000407B93E|nr:HK97 family phage prohead protease [Nocardioides alkalitolerans]